MKANKQLIGALRRAAKRIKENINDEYDWVERGKSNVGILLQELLHVGPDYLEQIWTTTHVSYYFRDNLKDFGLNGEDYFEIEYTGRLLNTDLPGGNRNPQPHRDKDHVSKWMRDKADELEALLLKKHETYY